MPLSRFLPRFMPRPPRLPRRRLAPLAALLLLGLPACDSVEPVTTCPGAALCARPPQIVALGTVQASVNPIPGAVVTLTAWRSSCGGTEVTLVPDPAQDTTDASGHFRIAAFAGETASSACLRVSVGALSADTAGITLGPILTTTDTVRLNLIGP